METPTIQLDLYAEAHHGGDYTMATNQACNILLTVDRQD